MTNAEAIKALKDIWFEYIDHLSVESMKHIEYKPAIDMAVEALEKSEISNEKSNESQTKRGTGGCVMNDPIDRQDAIDTLGKIPVREFKKTDGLLDALVSIGQVCEALKQLPSAQPTLYGYPVEHLAMIARVLQKENLPPERVAEMLSDIGRIVEMVRDEFEETLRKAVEQCMM